MSKIYKKECQQCGKIFETKLIIKKWCSVRCRGNYWGSQNREKIRQVSRKYPGVCHYCGKEYYATMKISKYCSQECYIKSKNKTLKRCCYCGKEFRKNSQSTYCSKDCMNKQIILKKMKICEVCGKVFKSRDIKQKACSKYCAYVLYSESNKGVPKKKRIEGKKCKQCGKEYIAYYDKQYYCSRKCRALNWNRKTLTKIITCKICDVQFCNLGTSKKKYCSQSCQEIAIKQRRDSLCDSYIKSLCSKGKILNAGDITDTTLIDVYRQYIKIRRLVKNKMGGSKNVEHATDSRNS